MTAIVPRERLLGSIAFSKDSYGVDLLGGNTFPQLHYEWLVLRLIGSVTVAGGTTNGTATAEAPFNLLKSFEIVISGLSGDEFIRIPLTDLRVFSHYIGRRPALAPKFQAPATAIGTNAFFAEVYLPFALEDMVNPLRGLWASNRYSNIRVRALWGNENDLISGGDRTETVDATTKLEVWGREYTNDPRFAVANDLLLHQRVALKEVAMNVTQNEFPIDITRTASFLRGILIKQMTTVAGVETPITNVISGEAKVQLVTDDADRKFEYTFNQLQRQNYEMYRGDLPSGYTFIDLSPRGIEGLLLNMLTVSNIKLKLDVTTQANAFLRLALLKYATSA